MTARGIQNTSALLMVLQDAGLDFIVIGGVAAISHGAATMTRDLDIAITFTPENLERLLAALHPYKPCHVTRPDLGIIQESTQRLCEFRLLLIDTDLGRVDILREVPPLGPAESLRSVEIELVPGRWFRVLELDALIAVKAHLQRPKDRIVELELRALRDQRRGNDTTQ